MKVNKLGRCHNLGPGRIPWASFAATVVPLFAVSGGEMISWRAEILFTNLYELKSRIWFRRNTTNLSEIIGYIDLSDFRQISPKHSRNNNKGCVGKSWYLKYLSCGVHLRNTPHIFLVTPTLWVMIMSKSTLRVTTRDHEWLWVTTSDQEWPRVKKRKESINN